MTATHALSVEATILIQAGFVSALAFLLLYSLWHNWWTTLHGNALFFLGLGITVVLLRPVLMYWHIISNTQARLLTTLGTTCQQDTIHHYPHAMAICAQASHINALPPDIASWITIQFLVLVPISLLALIYQLVRRNIHTTDRKDGIIGSAPTNHHLTDSP